MSTARAIGIRRALAARRKKMVASTARIQRAVEFADDPGVRTVIVPRRPDTKIERAR
jgi:hypothetical protein